MNFKENNVQISPTAKLGVDVKIGRNTLINDHVTIGDRTVIGDHCIIGEPTAKSYTDDEYKNPETHIGSDSLIRSHSILYAGCYLGHSFQTGHHATIREHTKIGNSTSVGTYGDIQGYVEIGNFCRIHSGVFICQGSVIGNFVFIAPHVLLTDDPYPPSDNLKAPVIGDFASIAARSIVLPGIRIGASALIGAGSVVTKNVPDFSLARGNPARIIRDVRDLGIRADSLPHYPWPRHFSRGMPWEEMGFERWAAENDIDEL